MKRIRNNITVIITVFSLVLCTLLPMAAAADHSADEIYVEPITFQRPDFIKGMDVSSVIALEQSGVRFKNAQGEPEDLFKILSDHGVNTIRVRVWNDPYDSDSNGYGGGNNDVKKAAEIGRRAAANSMKLLVDFHYSDFWADPSKQKAPKEWDGLSLDKKAEKIYDFTLSSLRTIAAAGADIAMVQVGNETTSGIAGEYGEAAMAELFRSGAKAVRAFDETVLVALHFTNPERTDTMKYFADFLNRRNVDYDVFATSYYPYWHGSLSNLTAVFNYVADTYGKYTMVAETSYAYTLADSDGHPNTVSQWNNNRGDNLLWDFSEQGQAEAVRAVMNAVNEVHGGKGLGVFYWEGAWITVGDTSSLSGAAYNARLEQNKALWNSCGSGWASVYAGDFDPDDAGLWYGGSAVDNQAFFGPDGTVLSSLSVFKKVGVTTGALLGDADGDKQISVTDAAVIQRRLARISVAYFDGDAADVDRSGHAEITDAAFIQRYLAGMPIPYAVSSPIVITA